MAQSKYAKIIGSLIYLINFTRLDIKLVVGKLSKTHNPNYEFWKKVDGVLRYLKGTMNYGTNYSIIGSTLECYINIDWASCKIDPKFTEGLLFTLGGGAIAWSSNKQTCIEMSWNQNM